MKINLKKFTNLKFLIIGIVFSVLLFTFLFFNKQEKVNNVIGVLSGDFQENSISNKSEAKGEEKELIKVILKVPDFSYQVYAPKESTVYEMMKIADLQNNNFSFKGREFSGLGFFVEEINGLSQNKKEGKYWIYYINGKPASVGVSQYKLKENDIITWKYEKEY